MCETCIANGRIGCPKHGKFTGAALMGYEAAQVRYAVTHSRHQATRNLAANTRSSDDQLAARAAHEAAQRQRYEQANESDRVRVLRF